MCTKCREVKNQWFAKILSNVRLPLDFKKKFDIIFGKGQYDKAVVDGKPISDWVGTCRKCGTAFSLNQQPIKLEGI